MGHTANVRIHSLIGLQVLVYPNIRFHVLPLHLCIYLCYIYLPHTHLFQSYVLKAEEWIMTLEKYSKKCS